MDKTYAYEKTQDAEAIKLDKKRYWEKQLHSYTDEEVSALMENA
jgi:hypothetical protein